MEGREGGMEGWREKGERGCASSLLQSHQQQICEEGGEGGRGSWDEYVYIMYRQRMWLLSAKWNLVSQK